MMKLKTAVSVFLVAAIAASCALGLAACGPSYEWNLADLGDGVNIHTELQSAFLAETYGMDGNKSNKQASGNAELSRPEPVHLEWTATPASKTDLTVTQYTVEISQNSKFTGSIEYSVNSTELDVYNLCVGTDYYWRVTAELSGGKKSVSKAAAFTTDSAAPRNMYVDGVTNVRDLGGWSTAEGGKVKQGMIYRCGRLNKSEQPEIEIEITQAGINTMLNEMGVKSEIDLRNPEKHNTETGGITSSPLGESVNYYNCAMEWVVSNMLTDAVNKASIRRVFTILADKSNYPVIYHCNIGTDRTGLFAILVNGLLGVSEEDLYRDYLFSGFGKINNQRSLDNIKPYINTVKSYQGSTLSEQIENCLLDLGVQQNELDAVRNILSA